MVIFVPQSFFTANGVFCLFILDSQVVDPRKKSILCTLAQGAGPTEIHGVVVARQRYKPWRRTCNFAVCTAVAMTRSRLIALSSTICVFVRAWYKHWHVSAVLKL